MLNVTHKSDLCEILASVLTEVDGLSLHPKTKLPFIIGIYTLSSLGTSLLDLPISATLRNIFLPQKQIHRKYSTSFY